MESLLLIGVGGVLALVFTWLIARMPVRRPPRA